MRLHSIAAASVLVVSTLAHGQANEAQVACDLERSKAEVQASTLGAASAFGSLGDAVNSERNVVLGVSKSLSGSTRAGLLREAAEAKCGALVATVSLDEHARYAIANLLRSAATVELAQVEEAIELAKENVRLFTAQVAANVATITALIDARSQLVSLENRKADLLVTLSTPTAPLPRTDIQTLLRVARENEAKYAGLASKSNSESAWDVVVSGGARQSLSDGSSAPFVALAFKYSFGLSSSRAAAEDVARYTSDLMKIQGGGYAKTIERQRVALASLKKAETTRQTALTQLKGELRKVYGTVAGLDTALANNVKRGLVIQMKVLDAETNGSWERLTGYERLLESLEKSE